MKPDVIERMECAHHQMCSLDDHFGGCSNCMHFEYRKKEWLRGGIEKTKGIGIPYNYNIEFNRRVSLFTIDDGAP